MTSRYRRKQTCGLTRLEFVGTDEAGEPIVKASPMDFDAVKKAWADWFALPEEERERRLKAYP
jgi:hypothetical protein